MVEKQPGVPREAEVVVVGAGINGCSIAYQLARRGKRVVVFDRRGICSGASGRNGGLAGAGSSLHSAAGRAVYALTSENLRLIRDELPAELGDDFALRLPGNLDIAMTDEQYEHLTESVRLQREHGIDVEMLDPAQVRDFVPVVSDRILGAKFAHGHGHLWPFQLVHALAAGARRHGARFVTHTPVNRLLTRNGAITGVSHDGGRVATGTVVVAANAWAPQLLPDLPAGALVPARGQILVTPAVAPVLPHPFGTNFDKEYGRQTATGQIVCGGFRRLDVDEGLGHYEEEVTAPVLSGIAGCLGELFPPLASLPAVRAWAGIMGFTADGLPLIGPYGGTDGLYVAAGFNGGGFSWAAAVGKALAQLLVDGHSEFDLGPFDPNRFAAGGVSWDNPFTAGEKNNPRRVRSRSIDHEPGVRQ